MDELGTGHKPLYPSTIWSEVERAEQSTLALEGLLKKYYRPLQAHLEFKFRVDQEQSADWLQEFIRQKVLLGNVLAKVSRSRGRFRTFLLNALDNFVLSELRHAKARIRCPEGGYLPFQDLYPEQFDQLAVVESDGFDVDWARTVLAETIARMESECQAKGRLDRWGVFKARLLDPLLDGAEAPAYEHLVSRFEFHSPAEASNALITAKRMFDRLLREVVAEYAGEGSDLEGELQDLKQALSYAAGR